VLADIIKIYYWLKEKKKSISKNYTGLGYFPTCEERKQSSILPTAGEDQRD
jgi:hypothetical protein